MPTFLEVVDIRAPAKLNLRAYFSDFAGCLICASANMRGHVARERAARVLLYAQNKKIIEPSAKIERRRSLRRRRHRAPRAIIAAI